MNDSSKCPGSDQLEALLAGSLPEQEQVALAEHLTDCETCRAQFDELTERLDVVGRATRERMRSESAPDEALVNMMNQLRSERPDAGQGQETGDYTRGPSVTTFDLTLDFLDSADDPRLLGKLGPYEITEVIGRGGMGVVLKGFDPSLTRHVAIKVLSPQLASNGAARRRFLREARAAAAISHDHVVTIHAVDETATLPYLVMEYISGRSLENRIKQTGPLELEEILRIGMQAASGLAAAHAQGLVHRDIKPANILLENGVERVKLTDFGLAKAADDARITQTGVVTGTPEYMSPEQARGEPVDHRSDLFSLGCVLYAMCAGRSPFRASTIVDAIRRVCDDQPRPIGEVNDRIPAWLVTIVNCLLAKDPEKRLQSATKVSELLGGHLAHLQQPAIVPQPAHIDPLQADAPLAEYRHRRSWLLLTTTVVLLLSGILLSTRDHQTSQDIAVSPTQKTHSPLPINNWALEFDGIDDYVLTPFGYDGSYPITVEAWVIPISKNPMNAPRLPHTDNKFSTVFANTTGAGMGLAWTGSNWGFWVHNDDRYVASRCTEFPFFRGAIHLAGVFDGDAVKLFVNGKGAAESFLSGNFKLSPLNFMIGADPQDGIITHDEFKGIIDEVRVSRVVRYTGDFKPQRRFETDDMTVTLYHFDEGEGKTVHDSSGNGRDAQVDGAKWVDMNSFEGSADRPTEHLEAHLYPQHSMDLKRLVEPRRDTLQGLCLVEDSSVVLPQNWCHLAIPYLSPDQYELFIEIERISGVSAFAFSLGVDGRRCWVIVDDDQNQKNHSGLKKWNGTSYETLGEPHSGHLLTCGKPATIHCVVDREGTERCIRVECDKKEILQWRGSPDQLPTEDILSLPDPRVITLGSFSKSTFLVTNLQLVPMSGDGQALSFADESAPAIQQRAEYVLWLGGAIWAQVDNTEPVRIHELADLPPSFELVEVDLGPARRLADITFPDLVGTEQLETLRLRGQRALSGTELVRLVNIPSLREVDLANTSIEDENLHDLAHRENLRRLDLSFTSITDEGLKTLTSCTWLQSLSLAGTQITDGGLRHLSKLTGLEELDLSGTAVSGDSLRELETLKQLRTLRLDHTQVGDKGLMHLQTLPHLANLSLMHTPITDAGIMQLTEMKAATRICLVGTRVTSSGATDLQAELPECEIECDGGSSVDLLRRIDVSAEGTKGNWSLDGGTLVSPNTKWPCVEIPYAIPDEYTLEVVAHQESKRGDLFLGLVGGDQQFTLSIDTVLGNGAVTGLELLDGNRVDRNETTFSDGFARTGSPYTILITVRKSGISVSRNGQLIVDWRGDYARLSPYHWQIQLPKNHLGISSYQSVNKISTIRLTPILVARNSAGQAPSLATREDAQSE